MKCIELTRGQVAIVDDEDFVWLAERRWYYNAGTGYALRTLKHLGKTWKEHMHKVILPVPKGMEVDHINGNKLDNRKENLRVCSHAENMRNAKMHSNNVTGLKGVHFRAHGRGTKRYRARLTFDGKTVYEAAFYTAEEAKLAYDQACLLHHGEFARLN